MYFPRKLDEEEPYDPSGFDPFLPGEAPNADQAHEFGAVNAFLCVAFLAICSWVAYVIKRHRLYYLPEPAAVIVLGILVGFVAKKLHTSRAELDFLTFQPEVFYFGLLPPLIFDAGYTCRRKDFFENLVPITLFAVAGTFISTFFIGSCTFFLGSIGFVDIDVSSPIESLLFGALLSAVNPAATLSVMDLLMEPQVAPQVAETAGHRHKPHQPHQPPPQPPQQQPLPLQQGRRELDRHIEDSPSSQKLLYSLLFGESVLNGAVAIALFHSFQQFYDDSGGASGETASEAVAAATVLKHVDGYGFLLVFRAVGSFGATCLGSVGTGTAVGLACAYFCKHTDVREHPHLELCAVFLCAYASYVLNEALELSGIVALFVCGTILAHYNSYNLSVAARATAAVAASTLAGLAEHFVFLYLGMGFFTG